MPRNISASPRAKKTDDEHRNGGSRDRDANCGGDHVRGAVPRWRGLGARIS